MRDEGLVVVVVGVGGEVGDTCTLHPSEQPATLGSCVRPSRLVK